MKQHLWRWVVLVCASFWLGLVASGVQAEDVTAKPRQKTALVLSGGGARGLAHVGVVNALAKLRIPYDCIAGTSMGAIAGGTYASGTSLQEAERQVVEADWRAVFADKPKRRDIPYFRKYEDYKPYFDFTLILDGLQLKAPRNFVGVQQIELFFRELAGASIEKSFDDLPIPFRAVATDLETGDAVVIEDGSLVSAMRASMSIPGVFPPIYYREKLLVDGGLSMNLPVSVGRQLCGEDARVIAVNVATPTYKKEEMTSFFSISEQAVSIGMKRNLDEQKALLREGDVFIEPKLDGLSSTDFERVREMIVAGEQAVLQNQEKLARFQVDDEQYQAWQDAVQSRKKSDPVIDHVRVQKTRWVNPAVMQDLLKVEQGQVFNMKALHKNINRIYARGDFSRIHYDLQEESDGHADIVLTPEEKSGRDFVRLGFGFYTDFEGDANFSAIASLRRAWLNRLDAEWRTDILLGQDKAIHSEWYQPASLGSEFFVVPAVYAEERYRDVFTPAEARFDVRRRRSGATLELGSVFGRWGEVRFGLSRSASEVSSAAFPALGSRRIQEGGYSVRTIYDQLDNTHFPHHGGSAYLNYYKSSMGMGADNRYETLDFKGLRAFTWGRNTLLFQLQMGSSLNSVLPAQESFSLGGMFNLSAYSPGYYHGMERTYGSLVAYRQVSELPAMLGRGVYAGSMLEVAQMSGAVTGLQSLNGRAYSGSAYLAADTIVGPVYLMASVGDRHQAALYMALGINF